jgi:uncharacterized OB-fold protein
MPLPDLEEGGSDLVITEDGPRLIGSCCDDCGDVCFPRRYSCLACGSRKVSDETLPGVGRLYTFSTVHISATFPTPYTLGYVDLENGVRLLARIEERGAAMAMDGPVVLEVTGDSYVFVPVAEDGAAK